MIIKLKAKQLDMQDIKKSLDKVYIKNDGTLITGSATSSIIAGSSDLTNFTIPDNIKIYSAISVYHDGKLLVEGMHYTKDADSITLIGYSAYEDDVITFVGYGSTGSLIQNEEVFVTKEEIFGTDGFIKPTLIRFSGELDDSSYLKREEIFGRDGFIRPTLIDGDEFLKKDQILNEEGYIRSGLIEDYLIIENEHFVKKEQILDDDGYIKPALIKLDEIIVNGGLVLGETNETAFRGDLGKVAYEHALSEHAPVTAQENTIERIAIGERSNVLPIINKRVAIPVGNETDLGVVKSSKEVNKVTIEEDGTMSINNISFDKIANIDGQKIIFNAGSSEE